MTAVLGVIFVQEIDFEKYAHPTNVIVLGFEKHNCLATSVAILVCMVNLKFTKYYVQCHLPILVTLIKAILYAAYFIYVHARKSGWCPHFEKKT